MSRLTTLHGAHIGLFHCGSKRNSSVEDQKCDLLALQIGINCEMQNSNKYSLYMAMYAEF